MTPQYLIAYIALMTVLSIILGALCMRAYMLVKLEGLIKENSRLIGLRAEDFLEWQDMHAKQIEAGSLMARAETACAKLADEYAALKSKYDTVLHRAFHYEIEIKRNRATLAKFHRVRGVDGKWARRV